MTKPSTIARPLFALVAALVAAPLQAQGPMTVTGQPLLQERVSFADLDLRRLSAQQTLKNRVHRAAARVCAQAEGPLADGTVGFGSWFMSAPTCTELTFKHARPQIASAVQRAKAGQQLAALDVIVTAPSASR